MINEREIFDQTAAFTAAVSAMCDDRVSIVWDGRACTDGETIHLPHPNQIISGGSQKALQGIACHEAAHIFYKTPVQFRSFVAEFDTADARLAADCYNAVADIADETRFERRFHLASEYFTAATTCAARTRIELGVENGHLPLNSTDDILIAAMLKVRQARIDDRSARRVVHASASPTIVSECVRILRSARTRSGNGSPARNKCGWNKLGKLARKLVETLRESGCSSVQSPPNPACVMTEQGGGGPMTTVNREVIADATDGQVAASFSAQGDRKDLKQVQGSPRTACFRRFAKLLLHAPGPIVSRPSCSGSKLGDLTRLRIDGKVLLRRSVCPDTATAVAVCLDCSDSMSSALVEVADVAASMARALFEAGGNVACWHFGRQTERVSMRRMHRVRLMGGTRTELVVRSAREWLLSQTESKKVLAVFTDGQAARRDDCAAEVRFCQQRRVKLLVGAVNGCTRELLLSSMPGAEMFEIGRNLEAGFHQAIRRIAM